MSDAIRVAIADDHPVVRRGLRAFLDSLNDIEVVGEAVDGEGAVQLVVTEERDHVGIRDAGGARKRAGVLRRR